MILEYVPVVTFETTESNSETIDAILSHFEIRHRSYLISLCVGSVPAVGYFRDILETHRPRLVLTSYRHIGEVVKPAVRSLPSPRPELWVVSSYALRQLEEYGVTSWADNVVEKPIYPIEEFAKDVARCLKSMDHEQGLAVR